MRRIRGCLWKGIIARKSLYAILLLCAAMSCVLSCTQVQDRPLPNQPSDTNYPEQVEPADEQEPPAEAEPPMETPPLNVEQIPDIVWIDTAQLTVQLAAEEIPIFDMRDYVDYAVARIANAMNIPVKYLSKRLDSIPQDVPIVLVFPSEADAIASWELLIRAGYNPELMSVLEGGMEQWTSEGLPTVDSLVGVC